MREAETTREERDRLRTVLEKVAHDLRLAEFGEGYEVNLPEIWADIRAALES